jgi:glycosyltransferase involved in cell wall biosynthesis
MRLLITTQAIDLDDPVLSFFHRWVEEFAKNAEHVHVICLKEGRHALPKNVSVHSLGKESGRSMFKYITRFYKYAWSLRREYDVVFVHMNPEYLVLGGRLWRLMRKRVGLWYIHPRSSWRLRYGMPFAHKIFSATLKSFPHTTPKIVPVGLGVDTDFFKPGAIGPSSELRVMCAARIAPVKRVECMIDASEELVKRHTPFLFDYYGEELPRDKDYAEEMRKRAEHIGAWMWKGSASSEGVLGAYQSHDVHVNATDTGSFDKAVFEAMACGCISVASNKALFEALPRELMFEEGNAKSLAQTLEHIAHLPREDREALREEMRKLALERYSLSSLILRVLDGLKFGIV